MGYVCVKKWRITNSTPHIPQSTMNDFRFSRFSLAGAFKQPNKNAKNALNNPLNNLFTYFGRTRCVDHLVDGAVGVGEIVNRPADGSVMHEEMTNESL